MKTTQQKSFLLQQHFKVYQLGKSKSNNISVSKEKSSDCSENYIIFYSKALLPAQRHYHSFLSLIVYSLMNHRKISHFEILTISDRLFLYLLNLNVNIVSFLLFVWKIFTKKETKDQSENNSNYCTIKNKPKRRDGK